MRTCLGLVGLEGGRGGNRERESEREREAGAGGRKTPRSYHNMSRLKPKPETRKPITLYLQANKPIPETRKPISLYLLPAAEVLYGNAFVSEVRMI